MGATDAEADRVVQLGVQDWIKDQLAQPASLELPYVQSLTRPSDLRDLQRDRVDVWFRNAVHGPDQLRQRVAFALSEILVVSQIGVVSFEPYGLASYYDQLSTGAFGNFRDLLKTVTLHPSMGLYLSALANQKGDPARNVRPNENYARELMQLFTIGLVELNSDGTVKLDAQGQPIPTYDQDVIKGFAQVFTGWTFAGGPSFLGAQESDQNQVVPMQLYPEFHDTNAKLLLDGHTVPAGQSGEQDLDAALDSVFMHPNVGPFIAKQLIQRLVTSNPSPAYVGRVAGVFNDNGKGLRGDLGAVVTAILLDVEARPAAPTSRDGKVKEPLLRLTQFWRAYAARSASGAYPFWTPNAALGEGPLQSPTVFNFFSPFYGPPGEIRDAGLVAPELEIATEYQNLVVTNTLAKQALALNSRSPGLGPNDVVIDIEEEVRLSTQADELVALVDEKLLGGAMSRTLREHLLALLSSMATTDAATRAASAIYLVVTSPDFAVEQ